MPGLPGELAHCATFRVPGCTPQTERISAMIAASRAARNDPYNRATSSGSRFSVAAPMTETDVSSRKCGLSKAGVGPDGKISVLPMYPAGALSLTFAFVLPHGGARGAGQTRSGHADRCRGHTAEALPM